MDERIKQLHNNWVDYKYMVFEFDILFADDENSTKLRRNILPDFFSVLNNLYWDHFLIRIARLLDPHSQGKNVNLTLFTLPEILKENGKMEWKEINDQVTSLKNKFNNIAYYRKKHLAHYDVDYTTGTKEFNTTTHIDEVKSFLDDMIIIINQTLKLLGHDEEGSLVMYPALHQGAMELMRILTKEHHEGDH